MPLIIHQRPVLESNYIYVVHEAASGKTIVIDPALAEPVLAHLEQQNWTLDEIWITHHHWDHVGGIPALKKKTGACVVGPAYDAARIPGMDVQVKDGDTVSLGAQTARVLFLPGHTSGHIAYYFDGPEHPTLFCGDVLFSLGCGRLFEGTPAQAWASLQKIRALPDETQVYCAHEYTRANAAFALSIDPDNGLLQKKAAHVDALRAQGMATVPFVLGSEKETNPFLRADDAGLQKALGMAGMDPAVVFAEIRERKDGF